MLSSILAGTPGAALGIVLAQATGSNDPSPLDFTTYGISGAVIAALMFGWLWPKPAVSRLLEDLASERARGDSLSALIRDDVVPALRDVAKATGSGGPLEKIAGMVERIDRRLEAQQGPPS
jgi:hypothetical protein